MGETRRALVTGTSSGIGLAIAQHLLDEGWDVIGLDVAPARLVHPAFSSTEVDLTDGRASGQAVRDAGSVSALVHAAGILRVGRLGVLQAGDGELMWKLHVEALTRIADIVLPLMAQAGNGRAVFVGSRVARGMAGRSQYAATKAAIVSLSRSWASEVVAQGVTVNVVSPAATQTAMLDDPARQAASPRVPPIGRLIQPHEIAAMVAYLLSPMAAAITGQDIQICGGASLPQ
ncbi:MAG: SDR family oxidoreductase [Comamonadaceae bacterium]|nr:MAG: SDR family oxidoreductase [Comamonadaceae bacterium]